MTLALVTGGAGFIGAAITRRLVEEGWSVRVLDDLSTGAERNVPSEAELFVADLRELTEVRGAMEGVDVVFHHGAVRSVPRSVDEPVLVEQVNALGTLHVLIAAEESGARRVVYASSSSIYGDLDEGVNHEDMRPNPLSPYAASKLAGETYCRVWTQLKGLSTVSMRYFNVFGPGQPSESKYAAVFPAFVSALLEGRAPDVHWDGEQSRDFTYIEDVVRANLLAAQAGNEANGAIINIAGGRPRSVNEVLKAVSRAAGRWIEPVRKPKRPGDVRRTHADITRAHEILGWTPSTEWKKAVQATVEWFGQKAVVPVVAGDGE